MFCSRGRKNRLCSEDADAPHECMGPPWRMKMKLLTMGFITGLFVGVMGCADASQTIAALIPAGAPVHEGNAESFGDVTFTHIEYGTGQDCISGCFYSHLCAIEDGTKVLLFWASWNQPSEAPKGIETICPGLQGGFGGGTGSCETPGRKHPFGQSRELEQFLSDEQAEGGPFRWCSF